jgi:general secretion pathway protein D
MNATFGGGTRPPLLPGLRITPDIVNNAVLIYASPDNYRIIERALVQLDRPQLQVAVDLTIAEVTLNDNLNYGVQFFLNNKFGALINSATPSLPTTTLPGFNAVLGNFLTPQVVINALHGYTEVKVLSNPSLVVVDNQVATLQVGDQVPVTTGTATVLTGTNSIVNTVDYKNTGIILRVQPRINSNGNVLMDGAGNQQHRAKRQSDDTDTHRLAAPREELDHGDERSDRSAGRIGQRDAEP